VPHRRAPTWKAAGKEWRGLALPSVHGAGGVRAAHAVAPRRSTARRGESFNVDSGEPSPGADVAAASPVPVQMWQRRAQSRRRGRAQDPLWFRQPSAARLQRCSAPSQRARRAEPGPDVSALSVVRNAARERCI
jgi:hypothetical protein